MLRYLIVYKKGCAFIKEVTVVYILFISMSISEQAAIDITYHALFGMLCSMFIMITTLLLLNYTYTYNYSNQFIIGINIAYLFVIIHVYLWYKLYQ